jgi:hypothetical protein
VGTAGGSERFTGRAPDAITVKECAVDIDPVVTTTVAVDAW